MRKTVLYIAMSLDGYIADQNGNVDWLTGQNPEEETMDTYSAFIETVDTILMGWNTYHQVVTELSPGQWPYEGLKTYVITHREPDHEASGSHSGEIIFTSRPPCELVNELKQQNGKQIWICGGASIAQQLMEEYLIDRFHLSIIPVLLGNGIRLFSQHRTELKLIQTKTYNGITDLVYEQR